MSEISDERLTNEQLQNWLDYYAKKPSRYKVSSEGRAIFLALRELQSRRAAQPAEPKEGM